MNDRLGEDQMAVVFQVAEKIHALDCCDGTDPGECSRSGADIEAARALLRAEFAATHGLDLSDEERAAKIRAKRR